VTRIDRILAAFAAFATFVIPSSFAYAQLSPTQASDLMEAIRAVNRCRISEAKKIDQAQVPAEEIARKIQPLCRVETDAFRRQVAGTSMAASVNQIDDLQGLLLAVQQERSPNELILLPH
jgi:hypothetical protein